MNYPKLYVVFDGDEPTDSFRFRERAEEVRDVLRRWKGNAELREQIQVVAYVPDQTAKASPQ